jgi:hypothetical protein
VEHEQAGKPRAEYGTQTLKDLSKTLTAEFGKGFSVSNIQFMRRFYQLTACCLSAANLSA